MNAQSREAGLAGQSAPAPGRPVGSLGARGRRQQLVAAYVEALGGKARMTAIQAQDVERAVDLVLLAREMRASVRQGAAKISDLTRLEGAADRAVRRLNLPPSGSAAPMGLHDIVAKHTTEGG
jgi:hypothetical protein